MMLASAIGVGFYACVPFDCPNARRPRQPPLAYGFWREQFADVSAQQRERFQACHG
jgi:hypothetical protein